jgi:hypothetical protein
VVGVSPKSGESCNRKPARRSSDPPIYWLAATCRGLTIRHMSFVVSGFSVNLFVVPSVAHDSGRSLFSRATPAVFIIHADRIYEIVPHRDFPALAAPLLGGAETDGAETGTQLGAETGTQLNGMKIPQATAH